MLTRLEVDGFKNLLDLQVDFGPFTCIAGVNGAGKSNIFDVIQFISLLADKSLIAAAQEVRGVHGERLGDPRDLFWNGYSSTSHAMRFAAEMIVPGEVEDDFGRSAEPSITFLRYELELGYTHPPESRRSGGSICSPNDFTILNWAMRQSGCVSSTVPLTGARRFSRDAAPKPHSFRLP